MRKTLPEFFQPTEEDVKSIWQNGTIVIDANVLLNLFRYSKKSRDELLNILNNYKDRLWVPYQVAYEFLENSRRVPARLKKDISETLKKIDNIQGQLEGFLELNKFDKYHLLKPEELRKDIIKFKEKLHNKVAKIKEEYETDNRSSIVNQIADLLDGRVGKDYDKNKLEEIFKQAEKRYKEKVPPGYKDLDDKKGESKRHLYGDYIWWQQAIDYSKEKKCDLIIVTDDAKDDWWFKVENETISPNVELIKEFTSESKQQFHMYRAARFMEYAKKYDNMSVSDDSIKEVKSSSSYGLTGLLERLDSRLLPRAEGNSFDLASHLSSSYPGYLPDSIVDIMGWKNPIRPVVLPDVLGLKSRDDLERYKALDYYKTVYPDSVLGSLSHINKDNFVLGDLTNDEGNNDHN